ncbi:MAG: mismatch-specific DNA-glycosylase [Hyphomonadaceae bacterium]
MSRKPSSPASPGPESAVRRTLAPRGVRSDTAAHVLPDTLKPGLRLWLVGTAAGPVSAAVGAYYAHPGNRFWRALHEAGLTPRRFDPHEFRQLLPLGIGLTDFCKTAWGVDSDLPREGFDRESFAAKVRRLRPKGLAFTSKTAASVWLARRTGAIAVGRHPNPPETGNGATPAVFVLPSPSGLATSYWSLEPWKALGEWFRSGED